MLTAQLIIARAIHIGASILLAGIFTFDLVMLAPARRPGTDLHEIERRLFRLAVGADSYHFFPLSSGFTSRSRAWVACRLRMCSR